ncbi:MAG: hypothetical protein ACYDC6_06520 [Acidobacteriaceae bacterium]
MVVRLSLLKKLLPILLLSCLVISASTTAWASPATFVTALPVALDQILARVDADTALVASNLVYAQFPVSVALGATSSLALFATFQQGFTSLDQNGQTSTSSGPRDTLLFARYTLYKRDRPKTTLRLAPLAGAYLPTGSNTLSNSNGLLAAPLQRGTGTFDPYLGLAAGYNGSRYGGAWDATYRWNPSTAHGISPGDVVRTDGQVEMRLLPVHLPNEGLPKELWISLETNLIQNRRGKIDNVIDPNSGGFIWNGAATLQLPTLHWELAMGVLLPIAQQLNGVGGIPEGKGFISFFEYYLSAPSWKGLRRRL